MKKILSLLCCTACSIFLFAQRTVTGSVADEKGLPIAGATVSAKQGGNGTSTDAAGTFSISIPASAKTLLFTAVNYGPKEVTLTATSVYNVILSSQVKGLDEVVVVAYGTTRKEALTGSVGQIRANDIKLRPINNVLNAIEGSVAGVIMGSANGQPGSRPDIRVRGFGSINASSEPLIVVDGIPYTSATSNINPDDVENITILKDAASTALYGSRAANGVVIITTKKGKKGRTNISARILQGFASRGLQEYDRIDAKAYYPLLWEAYRNSLVYPATGAAISLDSANRVASGLTNRTGIQGQLAYNPFNVANNAIVGTDGKLNPLAELKYPDDLDWTTDLMRTGSRKDYGINFSGGAEKADYFLSLGYVKEDGYSIKTDFKRYNARLNVNVQPLSWLKTGLNISGNYSYGTTVSNTDVNGFGVTSFVNPFFFSRNIGPIYPVYLHNNTTGAYVLDAAGNKIWDLGSYGSSALGVTNGVPNRPTGAFAGRHALAETILNDRFYKRVVTGARNYADIMFSNNFKFTNNLAIDIESFSESRYDNSFVGDGAPAGRILKGDVTSTALVASQIFSYSGKLRDHHADFLAGHESNNYLESSVSGFKQGQSLTGNIEFGNFTTINSADSYTDKYRVESFFSRLNYDYKTKYFLSASIRRDGNSRFAAESRWGTFWSAGGGWNIHKEKFMEKFKWLDVLKLRSSYGVVGVADGLGLASNNLGFYAYQGLYGFANNANDPGIIQSQTYFLNRKLTWEENKQFDLGIDFELFHHRLYGSAEFYNRVSEDLLFAVPLPLSSGGLTQNQNTVTMYNRGVELQLTGDIIRTKNFTWTSGINVSTVKNKITSLPPAVPEFITGTASSVNQYKKYSVGHSIFEFWLPTYYGVDPADGAALYKAANTLTATNRRIIAKNGGNDTVTTSINNGKFEYQGSVIPKFYGSFTQSFTYHMITLKALFTFQSGGKVLDALYADLMLTGTYGSARHTDILKRWQKPGDITDVPRMDAGAQRATDHNGASSRWLANASYLNIRNISVSYNLPAALSSRFKISQAQFFVSGENLGFFSKRKGMNIQQTFSGVTSNAYPPARVITAGLTLNL